MTYDATESSDFNSELAELYEFAYATKIWRYTSADEDQTLNGNIYVALDSVTRSKVDQSQELNKSNVKITVPYDNLVAAEFIEYPPEEVMSLIIYRIHRNDGDTAEYSIIWHGRVLNAEWKGVKAELLCEAVFTSLKRPGLRRRYQTQCPHILYGNQCTINKDLYSISGTVSVITSTVINISFGAIPIDGFLAGGIFSFTDLNSIVHKRAIESNISNDITVSYPIGDLVIGSTVTLYPGCRHNLFDCENKFSNDINYGGFTHTPGVNPFDGKTIF